MLHCVSKVASRPPPEALLVAKAALGCEFRSSSMVREPILAPLIMGRRPKHVCHYPSLGTIRYKKLEKVTDVRYGPPLLPTDLPP